MHARVLCCCVLTIALRSLVVCNYYIYSIRIVLKWAHIIGWYGKRAGGPAKSKLRTVICAHVESQPAEELQRGGAPAQRHVCGKKTDRASECMQSSAIESQIEKIWRQTNVYFRNLLLISTSLSERCCACVQSVCVVFAIKSHINQLKWALN